MRIVKSSKSICASKLVPNLEAAQDILYNSGYDVRLETYPGDTDPDDESKQCIWIRNSEDNRRYGYVYVYNDADASEIADAVIDKVPDTTIGSEVYSADNVNDSADDEYEEEIQHIDQEFTSENTSINSTKLPAVFKMVNFEPGTVNLDYGGGRFDNVADYLTQYDVINLVYDPFNRSAEHNKDVIRLVKEHGGADTATCSNVLNVIKEQEVRLNVLENIKKLLRSGGTVYITVYEGTGKGNEGPTKSGYQLNRKTADYVEEIQMVFPDARRKGKLLIATKGGSSVTSSVYSSEDFDSQANMEIILSSGISGDRFRIRITGSDGDTVFDDTYSYGYNASYDRKWATSKAPYVTDIIQSLCEQYSIDVSNIDVTAGKNVFKESDVSNGVVERFKQDYLSELTTDVTSATVVGMEDSMIDPPSDPEYGQDDFDEELEVEFDEVIEIGKDGSWEYEDDSYDFAKDEDGASDHYTDEYHIHIDDNVGIVEKIDELMEPKLPAFGRYRVKGTAYLVYHVSGIDLDRTYYSEDDYDEEAYTDRAEVEYLPDQSHLDNFEIEKII